MELKDFIKLTLVQIAEGVKEAQEEAKKIGGNVNPYTHFVTQGMGTHLSRGETQQVKFDVAITASESTASKEGIGVVVAAIALGKRNEVSDQSMSVSRVSFEVPLALPDGDNLYTSRPQG
ncbi:hypothetical protein X12_001115 [Xanthomonas arboricola]|uniref:hypothetical protein n=1 Tax=Xanthomonas arboricola TaxID=56448 RepID=UPI002B315FD5|nr:hypothetical protein X12_001115 [Xanthomonas arboricola]